MLLVLSYKMSTYITVIPFTTIRKLNNDTNNASDVFNCSLKSLAIGTLWHRQLQWLN